MDGSLGQTRCKIVFTSRFSLHSRHRSLSSAWRTMCLSLDYPISCSLLLRNVFDSFISSLFSLPSLRGISSHFHGNWKQFFTLCRFSDSITSCPTSIENSMKFSKKYLLSGQRSRAPLGWMKFFFIKKVWNVSSSRNCHFICAISRPPAAFHRINSSSIA